MTDMHRYQELPSGGDPSRRVLNETTAHLSHPGDNPHYPDDSGERFRDSQGCLRTPNRWGFNSFVRAEEADRYARSVIRRDRPHYVWRLPDGTFTWTARDEPPRDATSATLTAIEGAVHV